MKNPIKRLGRGGRIAVSLGLATAIGLGAAIPATMTGNSAPQQPGISKVGILPIPKDYKGLTIPLPVPAKITPGPAPEKTVVNAYYTVRAGDILGNIAADYGVSVQTILNANPFIKNANVLVIGWKLTIPGGHWVGGATGDVAPAQIKPGPYSGHLTQSQLAALWIYAGGNPKYAHIASAVAMAESHGEQYAYNGNGGRSSDRGYWQINSVHGSLSTFDPVGNAKAAIRISNNGTNWMPWVAYWNGNYRHFM